MSTCSVTECDLASYTYINIIVVSTVRMARINKPLRLWSEIFATKFQHRVITEAFSQIYKV